MKRKITILTLLALAATGTTHAAMLPSESHRAVVNYAPIDWRKACRGAEDEAMLNEFLAQHEFPTLDQGDKAIHAKNRDGMTPLHKAASWDNRKVAILLITRGADVSAKNCIGTMPLHAAAWNNHVDVVALLLAHGADVNATNNFGHTPLHIAASNGHAAVAAMLLACGADLNARDYKGNTPFDIAAVSGKHIACAELLRAAQEAKNKE